MSPISSGDVWKSCWKKSLALKYFPDFLTLEICERAVNASLKEFRYVADQFKTKDMCNIALEENPYDLEYVPEPSKTQEVFERAVKKFQF